MRHVAPTSTLSADVAILERAVGYLLGSLTGMSPDDLSRPTPCARWDLCMLLVHVDDSLCALVEAGGGSEVDLDPPRYDDPAAPLDLVARLRSRASDTLGAWADGGAADWAMVGDCPVSAGLLVAAGALEVAVHGWDIATARGERHPIPEPLAEAVLGRAALLVTPADRPVRFATARPVSPWTPAADRLLAFLGRHPG
jgi:uncharacterized protein (TIGR03086 family)